MIIRSDKWSHGTIGKNFDLWDFEITELKSSNGKGKGSRFDFEIQRLLRINLSSKRRVFTKLYSEISDWLSRPAICR